MLPLGNRLFLLSRKLPQVELKFFTFEDVTIDTAGLTGTRGDCGIDAASSELRFKTLGKLGLVGPRLGLGGLLNVLGHLTTTRSWHTVVRLEVLTERVSVDLNDGSLGKGVRTDKLVVRGVVNYLDNTGLAANSLSAPGEIASLETQSTVLGVTTTHANWVNTLFTDLSVSGLATHLELPLLAELSAHGASVAALPHGRARDTHGGSCSLTFGPACQDVRRLGAGCLHHRP